jgi:hypothetical protein
MTNALQEAIAEIAQLPKSAQDRIGEELLSHVDKLRQLRAKLEKGATSLDRGEGRRLDIGDIIERSHAQYGDG